MQRSRCDPEVKTNLEEQTLTILKQLSASKYNIFSNNNTKYNIFNYNKHNTNMNMYNKFQK